MESSKVECLYIIVSPMNKYLKIGRETVKHNSKKSLWRTVRDRYKTYYPNITLYIFRVQESELKEKKVFETLKNYRLSNSELFTCSLPLAISTCLIESYNLGLLESVHFAKNPGGDYKEVHKKVGNDLIFCESDGGVNGDGCVFKKDFARFKSVIPSLVTHIDYYGRLNPDRAMGLIKGANPYRANSTKTDRLDE